MVVDLVSSSSPMLRCTSLATVDFSWTSPEHPPLEVSQPEGFVAEAQIRSLPTGALSRCTVTKRCVRDHSSLGARLIWEHLTDFAC